MKAPLILGHSLSNMPKELYDIVINKNVIAINVSGSPPPYRQIRLLMCFLRFSFIQQDPLGQPAKRITHIPNTMDVWAGELVNQSMVLVVINYMDKAQVFDIDINTYGYTGVGMTVFNVWKDITVELKDGR